MEKYRIDESKGLEIGVFSLGDHLPNPLTGKRIPAEQRIQEFIEYAKFAEQAGIDFFGFGESHQAYFVAQAHDIVLAAIAQATTKIKLGSSSTIISTSDPVRVYENFATIDLISNGRAEIVAGRASRVGLFDLLGYDLRDYEELYEEKFDLLLKINEEKTINWNGQYRAPLKNAEILPRPKNDWMPIWRAVGGTPTSAIKAGLVGVPAYFAGLAGPASSVKQRIDVYREAARSNGFDPSELPVAMAGHLYAAKTTQQALKEYWPLFSEGVKRTNGLSFPKQLFAQAADPHNVMNIGSPQEIIERILYHHELFGHQRYIAQIDFGGMPFDKAMNNIELIGTEILPAVKKYTAKSKEGVK
ncbi:LLM class flavin-dependent oxidoreductase [Camelliibacillus cellulosilyticus]|uniref:LLM class flavin-dependent oxidoreductase n=1 Tax=Camelliibacillus cellulosilyticus TaxID=2174486 RepID=A0ABV9GM88_9BACL